MKNINLGFYFILLNPNRDTKMCMWKESRPMVQKSFLEPLARKKFLVTGKFALIVLVSQVEDLLILNNYSNFQNALVWEKL